MIIVSSECNFQVGNDVWSRSSVVEHSRAQGKVGGSIPPVSTIFSFLEVFKICIGLFITFYEICTAQKNFVLC